MTQSISANLRSLLKEPLRPAQVAAVSRSGLPLLGSLWFAFDEDRFWFNSKSGTPLLAAADQGNPVAVIVDEFHPPDRILQVRVRGKARIEPHDPDRVASIYRRYIGEAISEWPLSFPERLSDPTWVLWSVPSTSGLAVDHSGFAGEELRWDELSGCPF